MIKKKCQIPFSVLFFLLLEEESDAGDSDLSLRKLRSPLCADAQTLDAAADPRATVLPSKLGLQKQTQRIMLLSYCYCVIPLTQNINKLMPSTYTVHYGVN